MPDTAAILNEAYGLIEQGELSRARTMLQPLLESDSQNPDVWWLYTHAAADENEGRRALDRVQALDPNYPGASELRQRMGAGPRVLKPLSPLKPLPTPIVTDESPTPTSPVLVSPVPSSTDEPDLDDEFDETAEATQGRSLSSLLLLAGAAVLVIVVLLFGFSLLNQPSTPTTPTAIAGLPTDVGTPLATTDTLGIASTTDTLLTPVDGSATITSGTTVIVIDATVDTFSQTATALLMPTNTTAQSANPLVTDEPLAAVTDEPALATQNSLTVDSTEEATEAAAATQEALVTLEATAESVPATQEATLEIPLATQEATLETALATQEATLETALVTQEPAVTEEALATQEATLEATEQVVVTQEPTAEVTEPVATATEESTLILPTETQPAAVVTAESAPTEESGLILTEAATAEATQDPMDTLAAKLESLNVTRENIVVAETTLGPTLIVEVCAPPVATATTALTTAMSALAETIGDMPDIEAVGVNLSCDASRPFVVAVSASTAAAYGRGEIDTRTFRQGWAPTDMVVEETNG
jgi:hypothetical protein